jgi:hypothetical protein
MISFATQAASGLPEMPEKASEPPHWSASFSAETGDETVQDVIERIPLLFHIPPQRATRHRADAVIHDEDRADVRMDDEAGQGAVEQVDVVRLVGTAPLGVGHRDDAIEVFPRPPGPRLRG